MEKLKSLDMVVIKQKVEWLEIFSGYETKNKYSVFDSYSNEIYFAAEKSSFLSRIFLKALRPLEVHIINLDGIGVFKIKKLFRLFFHEGIVESFGGKIIGSVKRKFSILSKEFVLKNENGAEIYKIKAGAMHPWTFKIYKNGEEVGEIIKKWSGLSKEIFTDADNFTVKFPLGTTVEEKALLISTAFLADLVYFEK